MHSTFTQPNATVAPVHQDHYFNISATQDHSRSTVGTSHPFSHFVNDDDIGSRLSQVDNYTLGPLGAIMGRE